MRPPCSRPSRPSTAAAGPVFQAGDWRRLPDRENHLKTWSDELQKQGFNYDTSQLESKIDNLRTQARLLLSRIGATKRLYERTGDTTKLTDSAYKEAEVCWICWSAATLLQQGYWSWMQRCSCVHDRPRCVPGSPRPNRPSPPRCPAYRPTCASQASNAIWRPGDAAEQARRRPVMPLVRRSCRLLHTAGCLLPSMSQA